MATFPLATGARLLGIHPKTLHHWLTQANLPLAAHPRDARIKCVEEEHLLEVARLHGRPLQSSVLGDVASPASVPSPVPALSEPENEREPASTACSFPLSHTQEADQIQRLASLETRMVIFRSRWPSSRWYCSRSGRDRLSIASQPWSPSCNHSWKGRCPICRFQSLDKSLRVWRCSLKRSIQPNNWLGLAGLL